MGTRGALGFRLDGVDRIAYNHFDSYPDGLGADVLAFVKSHEAAEDWPDVEAKVRALVMVDENGRPTPEQAAKVAHLHDRGVSTGGDWYAWLRDAQRNPDAYLNVGLMPDNAKFLGNSLFCEYAYIVNLDEGCVEFYRGFNTTAGAPGRYANAGLYESGKGTTYAATYYGVVLAGSASFAEVAEGVEPWAAWRAARDAEDGAEDVADGGAS